MTAVRQIIDAMTVHHSEEEDDLIRRAYLFAKKGHDGQFRASGEPYVSHLVETSKHLARLGMDATTVAGGLLHDILEDTKFTEEDLTKEFGKEITTMVKGATKLSKVRYTGTQRHVESLRKFFIAMALDLRVLIIKLADRLHNLQTLEHLREDKQKRIAIESLEIHAALANRLGMGKLKGELEDNAFPYAFPKDYEKVNELLKEKTHATQKYLREVHNDLCKALETNGIKDYETDYRVKHKYSLYKKLQKYNWDIDKIYDIVALRVVVPTIEDCYHVLGIVHSLWNPLPGRIKDYIAIPKPNGYQSLHTTIFTGSGGICEIQIRTPEMHEEAEYGIASHFSYKEGRSKNKKTLGKKFAWIGELKELQKAISEPGKLLDHLKMDFFKDRIFVFTPKGDVIDLPEDSSPVDFAYAIHTNVGNHASGAIVNGKYTALKTKLKSGDIVEIQTKESAHPSSSWLEYAKTAFARKHIRSYTDENGFLNSIFKKFKN